MLCMINMLKKKLNILLELLRITLVSPYFQLHKMHALLVIYQTINCKSDLRCNILYENHLSEMSGVLFLKSQ